jgi:hypothetical protein
LLAVEAPVHFGFGGVYRSRPHTSFRGGNPPSDVGERLRRADRALLSIMYLFAIVAEASDPELHDSVYCEFSLVRVDPMVALRFE